MKKILFILLVFGLTSCAKEEEALPEKPVINVPPARMPEYEEVVPEPEKAVRTFQGDWHTLNHRGQIELHGPMSCEVKPNGDCRFWGTWQGVDFEYNVKFDGPFENLKGRPIGIDGAIYQWNGSIKDGMFNGTFASNGRHNGIFSLREKF